VGQRTLFLCGVNAKAHHGLFKEKMVDPGVNRTLFFGDLRFQKREKIPTKFSIGKKISSILSECCGAKGGIFLRSRMMDFTLT